MAGIELATGYVSLAISSRGLGKQIVGELVASTPEIQKVGTRAGAGFQTSFAKNATSRLGGALKAGIVGAGVTAMAALGVTITKGFSRLSAIEQAEAKLKGLGNSTKVVQSIMTDALNSVRGTAFAMDEAATTAATAVAAGIKPGKELENYLRLVADAATIAGTDMAEMGSIFNQTTTSGKVMSDDLNALADRGLPIFTWLQEAYNVSAVELKKMVTRGEVDAVTFRKVITENIGGAALASGDTTVGAWKNMWASISRIGANVLKGVFPNIRGALVGITGLFGKLEPIATVVGTKIGGALTTAAGAAQLFVGAFTGKGSDAFVPEQWMNPLIDAGGRVRGIFDDLTPVFQSLAPVAKSVFGLIGTYVEGAAKNYGGLFAQIGPSLINIVQQVAPIAQMIIATVTRILGQVLPLIGRIAQGVGGLIIAIMPGVQKIITAVSGAVQVILPVVEQIVGTLMSALEQNWPTIKMIFESIGSIVGEVFGLVAEIVTQFAALFSQVWTALGPVLLPLIQNVFGTLIGIIGGAFKIIDGLIKVITGVLTGDWQKAGEGLQLIVGGLWQAITSIFGGAIEGLKITFGALINFLITSTEGLRTNIATVFTAIGGVFTWLWENVASPVFKAIGDAWNFLALAFRIAYEKIFKPVIDIFAKIFTVFARVTFLGATTILGALWSSVAKAFEFIYNTVIRPVINFFADKIKWLQGVMAAVGLAIRNAFAFIGTKINDVYNAVIKPVIGFLADRLRDVRRVMDIVGTAMRLAFGLIGTKINDVYNQTIKPIIDAFGTAIEGLQTIFDEVQKAIGVVWDKIAETVKKPIDFVVNTVINQGLIGPKDGSGGGFNFLAKKVGVDPIDLIPWPPAGWQHGGPVFGSGRQRRGRDRIPAYLDHEEHVWTREEMARFPGGHAAMAKWRSDVRTGRFAGGLQGGGRVWPGTTRALSGSYSGHSGIDIPDGRGMPIYAAGDGSITYSGWGRGYGNAVFQSLEGGLTAVYGHTLRVLAQVGQLVKAGQRIALVDSTGNSSGNHIHFEINGAGGFGSSANRQFTLDWLKGAGGASGPTEGQGEAGFNWSPFEIFLAPFRAFIEGAVGKVSEITGNPLGKIIAGVPKMLVDGLINKGKELVGLGSVGKPGSFGAGDGGVDGAAGATARRAASILGPMFGFSDIGTYAGHDPSQARALDFMIKSKGQGDAMAAYAKEHASNLGVMYAIWNRRIWSVQRNREGWRPYSGTPNPHTDHVHLSFFAKGGTLPNGWAVTGEQGPELIRLPGARVYSNEDSRRMINTPNGPMRIEGTLDMGNGLTGFVRGVLVEEVRSAVNARS